MATHWTMPTANTAFISFVCLLLVIIKCKSFHYGIFPPSKGNSLFLLTFQGPRYSLWEIKARTYAGSWSRTQEKGMFSGSFFTFICTLLPLILTLSPLSSYFYFYVTCTLPLCLLTLKISFSTLILHFQLSWSLLSIDTFLYKWEIP